MLYILYYSLIESFLVVFFLWFKNIHIYIVFWCFFSLVVSLFFCVLVFKYRYIVYIYSFSILDLMTYLLNIYLYHFIHTTVLCVTYTICLLITSRYLELSSGENTIVYT